MRGGEDCKQPPTTIQMLFLERRSNVRGAHVHPRHNAWARQPTCMIDARWHACQLQLGLGGKAWPWRARRHRTGRARPSTHLPTHQTLHSFGALGPSCLLQAPTRKQGAHGWRKGGHFAPHTQKCHFWLAAHLPNASN
jgi:hypothetical protein